MTVYFAIAAGFLQCSIQILEQGMFHFELASAFAADNVVVIFTRNLIGKMSIAGMGGPHQSILGEEIQRAIDRRFGNTRQFTPRLFVDFTGREVCPGVLEDMQDGHPLGRHSKSA